MAESKNILNIPYDKQATQDEIISPNFNAGNIRLKCKINDFCPMLQGRWADYGLVYDENTLQMFTDDMRKSVMAVPGTAGIFPPIDLVYRNVYLMFDVPPGESSQSGPDIGTTGVVYYDSGRGFLGGFKTIDGEFPFVPYFEDQLFIVSPPLDTSGNPSTDAALVPLRPDEYESFVPQNINPDISNDLMSVRAQMSSRWEYMTISKPTDDETIGGIPYHSYIPYGLDDISENNLKLTPVLATQTGESARQGLIKIPMQVASPSIENKDLGQLLEFSKGVGQSLFQSSNLSIKHFMRKWTLIKHTPLFDGEDFFIEFREITFFKENTLFNPEFVIIINLDDRLNQYAIHISAGKQPKFTLRIYEPNDNVFTENSLMGETVLSTYDLVPPQDIFNQKELRVMVRNHLGKMIITFSGHENLPWIITQTRGKTQNPQELPILMTGGRIAVSGTGIQCGFLFGPIQYKGLAALEFPPPVKKEQNTFESAAKETGAKGTVSDTNTSGMISTTISDLSGYTEVENEDGTVSLIETNAPVKKTANKGNVGELLQQTDRKQLNDILNKNTVFVPPVNLAYQKQPFELLSKGISGNYVVLSANEFGLSFDSQNGLADVDFHNFVKQHRDHGFYTCDAQIMVEPFFGEVRRHWYNQDFVLRTIQTGRESKIKLSQIFTESSANDLIAFYVGVNLVTGSHIFRDDVKNALDKNASLEDYYSFQEILNGQYTDFKQDFVNIIENLLANLQDFYLDIVPQNQQSQEIQKNKDKIYKVLTDLIVPPITDLDENMVEIVKTALYDAAFSEWASFLSVTQLEGWTNLFFGDSFYHPLEDSPVVKKIREDFRTIERFQAGVEVIKAQRLPMLMAPKKYELKYCKPSILPLIRLVSVPSYQSAWPKSLTSKLTNLQDLILSYNESWTEQDFHTIEHTGTIKFLVGNTLPSAMQQSANVLKGLVNRAFYIEVWATYDPVTTSLTQKEINFLSQEQINALILQKYAQPCNYTRLLSGDYKLFTGICYGGDIAQEPGVQTMTCKIMDYSQILKHGLFFNSPFFDGMFDVAATFEILMLAGLRDDEGGPSSLIKQYARSLGGISVPVQNPSGRKSASFQYALPFNYDRLQNPMFRRKDGDKFWDALRQFVQIAGKVMYFDQYGLFHFDNSILDVIYQEKPPYGPIMWKYITKKHHPKTGKLQVGQYVFNMMERKSAMEDVHNDIHMISTTPNFEIMILHDRNWESITNPDSEGFLGYIRTAYQTEGMFGNEQSFRKTLQMYKRLFKPPKVVRFESYGLPVMPYDIITLDGQLLFVTSVTSDIIADENKWWQTIEAEWWNNADSINDLLPI